MLINHRLAPIFVAFQIFRPYWIGLRPAYMFHLPQSLAHFRIQFFNFRINGHRPFQRFPGPQISLLKMNPLVSPGHFYAFVFVFDFFYYERVLFLCILSCFKRSDASSDTRFKASVFPILTLVRQASVDEFFRLKYKKQYIGQQE